MPHQCVRCAKMYPDGAKEILNGCSCGARLFFFIKKKDLEESKRVLSNLSIQEKQDIEHDISEILHIQPTIGEKPVVLDIESIRVIKPGKYELDLVHLFKNDPLVIKLEEGKYMIDLPQVFEKHKK